MLQLKDKVALVTGVANKRSIAYAVAEKLAQAGCQLVITYLPSDKAGEREKLEKLTGELKPAALLPLDVGDPASLEALAAAVAKQFGKLHVLVHSIASAKRDELGGRFSDTSQEGFLFAQQISAYSLIALCRAFRPLMETEGASVIAMTYLGSERAVANYNVMGAAKASLEANVRYLAWDLGPSAIRVNALSPGPIRTLASAGIADFLDLLKNNREHCPLGRNVELEEVAGAAAFLASPMAGGITAQVIYVDCGYNTYG